jgi:hypothetical protein
VQDGCAQINQEGAESPSALKNERASAMLAVEEGFVAGLANLGIGRRLALIVLAGALAPAAVTAIAPVGQRALNRQAETVRRLQATAWPPWPARSCGPCGSSATSSRRCPVVT